MAAADVKHFVECSRDVESRATAVCRHISCVDLLPGEPAAVGEGVLHLIAVLPYVLRAEYRRNLRQFHLGDTMQGILHLLLLGLQLDGIRQMLPPAASAGAEMLTSRLATLLRRFYQAFDAAVGIRRTFFLYLDIGDVARRPIGHEHHKLAPPGYGIPFGGNAGNLKLRYYGQILSFSGHRLSRCVKTPLYIF